MESSETIHRIILVTLNQWGGKFVYAFPSANLLPHIHEPPPSIHKHTSVRLDTRRMMCLLGEKGGSSSTKFYRIPPASISQHEFLWVFTEKKHFPQKVDRPWQLRVSEMHTPSGSRSPSPLFTGGTAVTRHRTQQAPCHSQGARFRGRSPIDLTGETSYCSHSCKSYSCIVVTLLLEDQNTNEWWQKYMGSSVIPFTPPDFLPLLSLSTPVPTWVTGCLGWQAGIRTPPWREYCTQKRHWVGQQPFAGLETTERHWCPRRGGR